MSRRAAIRKPRPAPPTPAVVKARPATGRFHHDQPVIVTSGLSEGLRGRVRRRSELTFGDEPMWIVDLGPMLPGRTIRETFLAEDHNG